MTETPPVALLWVEPFISSVELALGTTLSRVVRKPSGDPLRWEIVLGKHPRWTRKEFTFVREQLKWWAEANNCPYQNYAIRRTELILRVFIKYPSRRSEVNPWEE